MRKLIILLLALAITFSLCACGGSKTKEVKDPNEGRMALTTEMSDIIDDMIAERETPFGEYRASKAANDITQIARANSIAYKTQLEYDVNDVKITTYKQADDYTYSVSGKVTATNKYGDKIEQNFDYIYYFKADETADEGYKLCTGDFKIKDN